MAKDKNDDVTPEPEKAPEAAAESTDAESTEDIVDAEVVEDDAEDAEDAEIEQDLDPDETIAEALSEADEALLDKAAVDLVAEMRSDMLRAQAELVNFRTRVERDRAANRDAVIAEVIRSLLPALDDLSRAEKHGDLEEGTPLAIVATKIRASFERYGLKTIGEKGEDFDPHFHEAVVQLPTPDATSMTIADVIDPGYALGERVLRAAKVAVSVPE
jgi:molecular chaperone GrpE